MNEQDLRDLKFRYLLWLYKTIREEFDHIERKFTQLDVDRRMFQYIREHLDFAQLNDKEKIKQLLEEFQEYINKKEKDGRGLKYTGVKLRPEYYWVVVKLAAVEEVIVKELGLPEKKQIKQLYEQQMRNRILASREH